MVPIRNIKTGMYCLYCAGIVDRLNRIVLYAMLLSFHCIALLKCQSERSSVMASLILYTLPTITNTIAFFHPFLSFAPSSLHFHNPPRRNELFRMSGIRGNYPQFFLVEKDGSVSFLGDWNAIEEMNDASGLPLEILEANPGIPTWKTVLG